MGLRYPAVSLVRGLDIQSSCGYMHNTYSVSSLVTVGGRRLRRQETWSHKWPEQILHLCVFCQISRKCRTPPPPFSFSFLFFKGIALPPVKTESLLCKHLIRRTTWRLCVSVELFLLGGSQACQDFGFLLLAEMTNCRRFNEKVARKAFLFFFLTALCTCSVHNEELQHGLCFSWELTSLSPNHSQMFTDSFNTSKTQISARGLSIAPPFVLYLDLFFVYTVYKYISIISTNTCVEIQTY